jgi:hypothetical protein
MTRRQFVATWISVFLLHFLFVAAVLFYQAGALTDWFLGQSRYTETQSAVWSIGRLLFQPGGAALEFLSVHGDFGFWLVAVLNSALWGAVISLVAKFILRWVARRHAF